MSFTKGTEISNLFDELKLEGDNFFDLEYKILSVFPNKVSSMTLKEFVEKLHRTTIAREGKMNSEWLELDLSTVLAKMNEIESLRMEKRVIAEEISSTESQIKTVFEDEFLEIEEVEKLVKILKFEYKSFLKRLFSTEYKEIFQKNKRLTKELKLNYEGLISNVEKLATIHSKSRIMTEQTKKLESYEQRLSKILNVSQNLSDEELTQLKKGISWGESIKNICYENNIWLISLTTIQNIVEGVNVVDWTKVVELADKKEKSDGKITELLAKFSNYFENVPLNMQEVLKYIQELEFNTKEEFFDYKRIKEELLKEYRLDDFIEKVEGIEIQAKNVELVFLKRFILLVLENIPEYNSITNLSTKAIMDKVDNFKKEDKSTFDLARIRIFNALVDRLPNTNENVKTTGGEIEILKKELTKKARLLPTRKLIENLPTLLPRLKPCIMMSPLTVSTYFSSNSDWEFDLVIFDEASQVRPEFAVAAISRGKQVIVAGDSKQMPPTSFFNSSSENEEDDEEDIQDLESILDELSVKIPETYLNWHYRSKDESLITFSNKKFYNDRLFTFPTDNLDVHSNVRFTHVENGVWESKYGNTIEAEKVTQLIYDFAVNYPEKSLGVVAFGKSQTEIIEDKVLELREQHKELESFFDENKSEPFFIKNLENVQGDERDIIILSVGYGKDPQGKLRMNFGPLIQSGGERRLNVAVSRSRETMHVVSSLRGIDLSVDKSNNENLVVFRDFLEFAEKGVGALIGYNLLEEDHGTEFDSDFEENVYDYLTQRGYKVHTQVGASGYRIDMAVIHPNIPGRYVLAIECDGAAYHSSRTARDRDRLRQEILESKGWSFYRIWSTTWIHDNQNEKIRLIDTIEKAIQEYSESGGETLKDRETLKEKIKFVPVDMAVDNVLPFYSEGVYVFKDDIPALSDIIMLVANKYVGYEMHDLMRHINKKVFGKERLTQGYKDIYEKAFLYLQKKKRIELKGEVIIAVY
ncbi:Superfamily I DNA and/or RNA helicase [Pilibacter termitis]|uniref:Superfamily I DNA and/or RNA helicase n=1 Tax=Pilibacter termitis TaxID=263852 RepID=A0A1T4MZE3_9ENTE|nr:AAA domain-containing protein [Pilibacter termitis]SJZ72429.1 Superfamily I DNA and/or RNA helicase [Pilibacter termitis]